MRTATSPNDLDNDSRWKALERRDPDANGRFVYAVKTTGIYCLASCASRRPNRANVVFFDDSEAAQRAGYRACKRCRPESGATPRPSPEELTLACRIIEQSAQVPSLAQLANEVGVGAPRLARIFQEVLGISPIRYAREVRARRLRENLAAGESVAGAIFAAGFGSIGRGYEAASDALGMTPGRYKAGAAHESIRFATAQTSLGWLLVASTDRGLCSIELGDSSEELEARLRQRFPRAEIFLGDPDRLSQVVAMVENPGLNLDLPIDVRGTAFQRQVWDALRAIPTGKTVTYAELAESIGRTSATRAVASACASNILALAIPCHRVVRSDGTLGGYRWGVERKQALLDREARPPVPLEALDD